MKIETKEIPLSKIKTNPNNPRFIKDEKYKSLLKSLQDFPEMKQIREIVTDENMIILGGNMRFKAMKELGEKTAQVKIVSGLTEKKKQEFIVKDNQPYGSWDMDLLANDFELGNLLEWGFEEDELGLRKKIDIIDSAQSEEACKSFTNNISGNKTAFYINGYYGVIDKKIIAKFAEKYGFEDGEDEYNGEIFKKIIEGLL